MKGIMKGYDRLPPMMKGYKRCSKMLRIWRKNPQVSSVRSVVFKRPVGWSRSISMVGSVPPTGQHGRYRRSVRLHLRRLTVDIDGQFGP